MNILQGDFMQMREADAIVIDPGKTTSLEPGGYHIMFFGLKSPLKSGEKIDLLLTFADGKHIQLELPVKSIHEE